MATNPRYKNGNYRRGLRARMKARGDRCHICGGEIDYSLPYLDPMSFVIDEKIPISKWKQYGYDSPEAVAMDPNNTFAAHRMCNAAKGARVGGGQRIAQTITKDGNW